MAFELPPLPYPDDALEPDYSAKTISFHYGKHHKAYVDNLNKLVGGTDLEGKSLEELIMFSAGDAAKARDFQQRGPGVEPHLLLELHDSPAAAVCRPRALAKRIGDAFGSFEKFAEQFKANAVGRFGSGWGWLVLDGDELKIVNTINADTPMTKGQVALLTVDVWEHAYYLDYQNRRPDFVQAFLDHLVNWDFAAENLK